MDRTEFLQRCQKISVLEKRLLGTKQNIPDDLKVIHNGIVYYPVAYKLYFSKGQPQHTAILHDLSANSITHADLERVTEYDKNRNNIQN